MQEIIEKIIEYKNQEEEKTRKSSLYEIQAFSPVLFQNHCLQTEINHPSEIWKYYDSMHNSGYKVNFKFGLHNCLTKREEELIRYCLRKSTAVMKKFNCDRIFLPINSISRALISYRYLKKFLKKDKPIIEWGPGSGFLGLMLLNDGYKYSAMDISMGFYFAQKFLWEDEFKDTQHKHYKWWQWIETKPNDYYDILSNHMLAEMHLNALKFNLRNNNLNQNLKRYFFESFGHSTLPELVSSTFNKYGNKINFYVNKTNENITLYYGYFSNEKNIKRNLGIRHYLYNLKSLTNVRYIIKLFRNFYKGGEYEDIFSPYVNKNNINDHFEKNSNFINEEFQKESAINIVEKMINQEFNGITTDSPDKKFVHG